MQMLKVVGMGKRWVQVAEAVDAAVIMAVAVEEAWVADRAHQVLPRVETRTGKSSMQNYKSS